MDSAGSELFDKDFWNKFGVIIARIGTPSVIVIFVTRINDNLRNGYPTFLITSIQAADPHIVLEFLRLWILAVNYRTSFSLPP